MLGVVPVVHNKMEDTIDTNANADIFNVYYELHTFMPLQYVTLSSLTLESALKLFKQADWAATP